MIKVHDRTKDECSFRFRPQSTDNAVLPASKRDYKHMHNNGREPIGGSVAIPRFSTSGPNHKTDCGCFVLLLLLSTVASRLRACKPLMGFPLCTVDYSIITRRPESALSSSHNSSASGPNSPSAIVARIAPKELFRASSCREFHIDQFGVIHFSTE